MTKLSELHRDVLFKHSCEQIIWQPRMTQWYTHKIFNDIPLPPPYTGMTLPDIYRKQNASDRLYEYYNLCFKKIEDSRVFFTQKKLNEKDTQITIETPVGKQVRVNRWDNKLGLDVLKWEIETEEELKVGIWRNEHTQWEWDKSMYDRTLKNLGDLGAPTIFLPRMNVQNLLFDTMGYENAFVALIDKKDMVEAYFKSLEKSDEKLLNLVIKSPIDIICFGENIDIDFFPETYLKDYYLPVCQSRCEKLHAVGKFVCSHWGGDCSGLLHYIKESGVDGVEALTPSPQGDINFDDLKTILENDIILLDGLPSIFFTSFFPVYELIEFAKKVIDTFAPNLVLGISEGLSLKGEIERVSLVGDLVNDYNSR